MPSQAPDPLTTSSGLTYRGLPIIPVLYTFGGFPSDKDNGLEPSLDTFTVPMKSTGQTTSKVVNPRAVCVTAIFSTLVTDTHAAFDVVHLGAIIRHIHHTYKEHWLNSLKGSKSKASACDYYIHNSCD